MINVIHFYEFVHIFFFKFINYCFFFIVSENKWKIVNNLLLQFIWGNRIVL